MWAVVERDDEALWSFLYRTRDDARDEVYKFGGPSSRVVRVSVQIIPQKRRKA
jgi:hypothetical protein